MRKGRYARLGGALLLMGTVLALAGCLGQAGDKADEPATAPPTEPEVLKLKVAYYSESQFKREFGDVLRKIRPELQIEVVPTMDFSGKTAVPFETAKVLAQKPDIVFGLNAIAELSKADKLVELTSFVRQDQLDLDVFAPAVLEKLREIGNGRLVAFSPTFQSAALFYNKHLFDQAGVPYPTNKMSWPNVLELAKRFARTDGGTPRFGLENYRAPYLFMMHYMSMTGAGTRSEDGRAMLYNSDKVRTAIKTVAESYGTNAIYLPPEQRPSGLAKKERLLGSPFIAGTAAMSFSDPSLLVAMKEAAGEGIPPINWDIVTEPVDPAKPNNSISAIPGDAFAISADSPDKQTAWTFLKTIVGPEMAKELAKSKPEVLSVRKDQALTVDGRRMDAFYELGINQAASGSAFVLWPAPLAQQISEIRTEELNAMFYGRKTADEALAALQSRSQQAIDAEYAKAK